ncbi:hypothetical protein BH18ACI3_BH18ACI3_04640 [soil metagenome]
MPGTAKKQKFLDSLADENGVAIVVVASDSHEVSVSNNNSMCRNLYSSAEFAPSCAQFCGKAFERAVEAGKMIEYECYAGLTCKAVPVTDRGTQFVAIVGRTFLKAENYRKATEKAVSGEWSRFRPSEFFENILMTGSKASLEKACAGLKKFTIRKPDINLKKEARELKPALQPESPVAQSDPVVQPNPEEITRLIDRFKSESEKPIPQPPAGLIEPAAAQDVREHRSLIGSLMKLDYKDACVSILNYLSKRYALETLVWLERRSDRLDGLFALGRLSDKNIRIGIAADNERLLEAAKRELPYELYERSESGTGGKTRTLNLFPVIVGSEILGAIGVEAELENTDQKRDISRLAQTVASQLEILRLRDEVSQRDWLSQAVKRFNESLKKIDADDFWLHITQISAELLGAERASILIQSEKSNSLHAKAAIGSRINLLAEDSVGSRVAQIVLNGGTPVVVSDIGNVALESAPLEWSYKTKSFISYPILIGERKIGVLNFTDRAGGDAFNERDLELLQAIAPQIAVAIDRTTLKDKAGEYEQLSVTDPLTGLLNRRYIEERLGEEILRSARHHFPMSLMMLDVDNFKSYNDSFGHPAGDAALEIVADVLKGTLRGDDVAARYGGEEFAILLPQTSCEEAAPIAERIRQRIERTQFPKRRVTVSIGIAEFSSRIESPKDLISAADVALYEAKNHGRNNVRIFNSSDNSLNDNIH